MFMSNSKSFEDSLDEIKLIIKELESGTLSLEEMIKMYEEGVGLMQSCRKKLDKVELRIKKISQQNINEVENNN